MQTPAGYRDHHILLSAFGAILLAGGIVALVIGPLELHAFYLFSEGGRHHYPGFRFGTFMYANIAAQVAVYYLVAALGIVLGYGHLAMRRWARVLVLGLLWVWIITGLPLSLVLAFMLFSAKAMPLGAAVVVLALLALSYLAAPVCLLRFYGGRNVRATFARRDRRVTWVERLPLPVLALCLLLSFYLLALHGPMLLNGTVPFLGALLYGLEGIVVLDLAVVVLGLLLWGLARLKRWAWWGALIYLVLLTASTLSLARFSWAELLAVLRLPPTEMRALSGIPLHGLHLALLLALPLLGTLVLLLVARRYYTSPDPALPDREKGRTSS
jgi:hypothetical protein